MFAYALLREKPSNFETSLNAIEIADLAARKTVRTLQLGSRRITNFAVGPGGKRLFLCDREAQAVLEVSSITGGIIHSYPVQGVQGCLLGDGGTILYASGWDGVLAFDTLSGLQLGHIPGDSSGGGLAFSRTLPQRVGFATTVGDYEYSLGVFCLANPQTLQLDGSTGLAPFSRSSFLDLDLAFTSSRALVWDKAEGTLHQVDLPSPAWNFGAKVALKTARAQGGNSGELSYSEKSRRAYVVTGPLAVGRGARRLGIIDPVGLSFQLEGGFAGEPVRCALNGPEDQLVIAVRSHLAVRTSATSTLDLLDVRNGTYTRAVYTFSEPVAAMTVAELHVPAEPYESPRAAVGDSAFPVGLLGGIPAGGGGAIVVVGGHIIPIPPPVPVSTEAARLFQLTAVLNAARQLGDEGVELRELVHRLLERERRNPSHSLGEERKEPGSAE